MKIATFENGLLRPYLRNEQIREDPAKSFAASRGRARKHVLNTMLHADMPHIPAVGQPTVELLTQAKKKLAEVVTAVEEMTGKKAPKFSLPSRGNRP